MAGIPATRRVSSPHALSPSSSSAARLVIPLLLAVAASLQLSHLARAELTTKAEQRQGLFSASASERSPAFDLRRRPQQAGHEAPSPYNGAAQQRRPDGPLHQSSVESSVLSFTSTNSYPATTWSPWNHIAEPFREAVLSAESTDGDPENDIFIWTLPGENGASFQGR